MDTEIGKNCYKKVFNYKTFPMKKKKSAIWVKTVLNIRLTPFKIFKDFFFFFFSDDIGYLRIFNIALKVCKL